MLIKGSKSDELEVENRNMVLISVVASCVKALMSHNERAVIVIGFRDEFYDTRKEFVRQLNKVFKVLKMRIQIETPVIEYREVGKKRLIDTFTSMGYGDVIDVTWSCYVPHNDQACETCPARLKRSKATDQARASGYFLIAHPLKKCSTYPKEHLKY